MSLRRIRHSLGRRLQAPVTDLVMKAGDQHDPNRYDIQSAGWHNASDEMKRFLNWTWCNNTHFDSGNYHDALQHAAGYGSTEVMNLLLADDRFVPSTYDIAYAVTNGHTEIVSLMLKNERVDSTARLGLAITFAKSRGYTEMVAILMAAN